MSSLTPTALLTPCDFQTPDGWEYLSSRDADSLHNHDNLQDGEYSDDVSSSLPLTMLQQFDVMLSNLQMQHANMEDLSIISKVALERLPLSVGQREFFLYWSENFHSRYQRWDIKRCSAYYEVLVQQLNFEEDIQEMEWQVEDLIVI